MLHALYVNAVSPVNETWSIKFESIVLHQSPFQGKSVHSEATFAMPSGSYFRHAKPSPSIYLIGEILKSQKLAKLTFK